MKEPNKKLYIGGLPQSVTKSALLSYFNKYGPVSRATIIFDKDSGRSRCFGFVTMQTLEGVTLILNSKHSLNGKLLECRRATPVGTHSKVFVGGLAPAVTYEEFTSYFAKFGAIVDAVVMKDKGTGKPRGFGFVTFAEDNAARQVLKESPSHFIRGKWVECKRSTPKEELGDQVSTDVSRQSLEQAGEEEAAELCHQMVEHLLSE